MKYLIAALVSTMGLALPVIPSNAAQPSDEQCQNHLFALHHPDFCKGKYDSNAGQNDGDTAAPGSQHFKLNI